MGRPKSVSLPVLSAGAAPAREAGAPTPREGGKGRMRRRRAAVMIAVYALMTAHIVQWRLHGRTVSPAVLSDSMHTLENGELNTGFILFALVGLATLIAGRFLCGWACHMGALQDLCAWLLRRTLGIRARPFRARLLGYVPVGLALYMFVWPTFKRTVLAPLLGAVAPGVLAWMGGPPRPFPGLSTRLITDDMWGRLPSVAVAIPFLLVCGFATVYFLGARGLCRYGCPYGGVFAPATRLAPVGIVVDPSRCDGCGRCTAACGSGIRVHKEVAAYGFVTDDRCIRSLDCIEVCPQDALSLGLTRPAVARGRPKGERPRVAYDLTWAEELIVLGVFALTFANTRGLYGVIPMLMAVSVATCAAAGAWVALRVVRKRDVRFGGFQLKRAGRFNPAGAAYIAASVAAGALLIHSGAVRLMLWRAGRFDDRVMVSREVVFAGDPAAVPEEQREAAAAALRWYRAAAPLGRGGWGLGETPTAMVREGWLNIVLGDYAEGEAALRRAMVRSGVDDGLTADIARLRLLRGDHDGAVEHLRAELEFGEDLAQCRDLLAWLYVQMGHEGEAVAVYERALERTPHAAAVRASLGALHLAAGRVDRAIDELNRAVVDEPGSAVIRHDLAVARFMTGDMEGALAGLEEAASRDPAARAWLYERAAQMLEQVGRLDEAGRYRERSAGAASPTGAAAPAR